MRRANVEATAKRLGVKAGEAVAYVLKTLNTAHAGKMSVARVLAGQIGDGVTLQSPEREAGRVAGTFKMLGQNFEKRGPAAAGETVALGQARTRQDRRHALRRQAGARGAEAGPAAGAGAGDRGDRQGAQGRRQARPGHPQAARRGPLGHHRAQPRDPRGGDVGPGRNAPAGRGRAAGRSLRRRHHHAQAERRLQRNHQESRSSSAAGTRSSPAATASSATWCSTSSRCRAVRASSSRTRSPAAWCRATTSPRSRRA